MGGGSYDAWVQRGHQDFIEQKGTNVFCREKRGMMLRSRPTSATQPQNLLSAWPDFEHGVKGRNLF